MENQITSTEAMPPQRPANYLILAVITTFMCCNVVGVVSIIYAARVNAKWDGGDHQGAIEDSKNAKLWALIGLIGGAVLILLFAIFYGAVVAAALSNSPSYSY